MTIESDRPKSKFSSLLCWFLIVSSISIGIFTAVQCYFFYTKRWELVSQAKKIAIDETKKSAGEVDKFLATLKPFADSLAEKLATGNFTTKQQIKKLVQAKPKNISGVGIAFAPYAIDKDTDLFAPYFTEREGTQELLRLEDFYDYTQWKYARYAKPIRQKKGIMFEPFFDVASNTIVAEYARPFYDNNKKLQGVIFVNHSAESLLNVISGLNLGRQGYGFVLSKQGLYIAHPDKGLTLRRKTIFDVAEQMNNPALAQAAQKALAGQPSYIEHKNITTAQKSWMFFESLPGTGWVMGTVFVKDEIPLNTQELKNHLMLIGIGLIFFLLFLTLLLTGAYNPTDRRLWLASNIISVLFLLGTFFAWHSATIQIEDEKATGTQRVTVYDKAGLQRFLEQIEKARLGYVTGHYEKDEPEEKKKIPLAQEVEKVQQKIKEKEEEKKKEEAKTETPTEQIKKVMAGPVIEKKEEVKKEEAKTQMTAPRKERISVKKLVTIPTGLYLHHLEFEGTNNLRFIGHVWQRYHKEDHKNLKRGIVFPQAEEVKISEAYRFSDGAWEVIGWKIDGTLNQAFEYGNYPFDTRNIEIQLWPAAFDESVVFVPDFSSYEIITPSSRPGLNKNIVMQDWTFEESFFSYKVNRYFTNFGFYLTGTFATFEKSEKSLTPELYFNVILNRFIITSLLLDLLPIIVVLILIFIALHMMSKQQLEFQHVLGITGSLFFTAILAHLQFKNKIDIQQIVFFEYFYFILHFIILASTITAILYSLKINIKIVQYKDAFILRLLYWPFVSSMIFTMSMLQFY